jgi:hypothetical protein
MEGSFESEIHKQFFDFIDRCARVDTRRARCPPQPRPPRLAGRRARALLRGCARARLAHVRPR